MKLITKEIASKLPKLYETDGDKDKMIYLKLFCPWSSPTWYIAEYDADEGLMFGYVTGMHEDEWGYVSLEELEGIRHSSGLKIERDIHFMPKRFSELRLDKIFQ